MIVRNIQTSDYLGVKRVGNRYAKDTLLGLLNDSQLDLIIKSCFEDGIVLIAEKDGDIVGVIGGKFVNGLPGGKMIEEVIWYVEPEHRGIGAVLFDSFLDACKKASCVGLMMVAYNNDSFKFVERFYLRNGFKEIERRYYKEL